MRDPLEQIWDHLLSRHPSLIEKAYIKLSKEEQSSVLNHLEKMINEEGWHDQQRISARAALAVIRSMGSQ